MDTQITPIKSEVVKAIRHLSESFFMILFPP